MVDTENLEQPIGQQVGGGIREEEHWTNMYDIKWAVEATVALRSTSTKGFCTGVN